MKRLFPFGAYRAMWLFLFTLFLPTAVQAHVGFGQTGGLLNGLGHPIGGLDHVLAMVAVGLWAAQRGGRALWLVPSTFLVAMTFGGVLGAIGLSVPFVEQGVVISVVGLGVLIAVAAQLPVLASAIVIGAFALFHGHIHGAEMPLNASALAYGTGFLATTALLHGMGVATVLFTSALGERRFVRVAGGTIALCGVYLWLAA